MLGAKPTFGFIPIDKIEYRPGEYNIRSREDIVKELDEMIENVKIYGILQPIIVNKIGDKYIPIAGQRRVEAAKRAGLKEIPAIIYENLSPIECIKLSLSETIFRRDVGEADLMEAVTRLYREYGSYKAVAQILGKSETWVRKYIKIDIVLPDEIKRDEKLGVEHKATIADVIKRTSEIIGENKAHEIAHLMAEKIKTEGLTSKDVKDLAKEVIKAAREESKKSAQEIIEAGVRSYLKEKERVEREKKITELFGPHSIVVMLDPKEDEALTKASTNKGRGKEEVARDYIIEGLRREGYLS